MSGERTSLPHNSVLRNPVLSYDGSPTAWALGDVLKKKYDESICNIASSDENRLLLSRDTCGVQSCFSFTRMHKCAMTIECS